MPVESKIFRSDFRKEAEGTLSVSRPKQVKENSMKAHTKGSLMGCLATLCIAPAVLSQTITPLHGLVCKSTDVGSCAIGLNSQLDIVGFCMEVVDPGPPSVTRRYGWVLRQGVKTYLAPPAAGSIVPWGINGRGDISGYWWDGTTGSAFLLRDGQMTYLQYPGSVDSFAGGINNEGDIVGWYRNLLSPGPPPVKTNYFGFMWTRHGEYKPVELPLTGVINLLLYGINSRGDIVGHYRINDGYTNHAFLLTKDGRLTTIDPPDMAPPPGYGSMAYGVNSQGDVSGDYRALVGTTTRMRGFIWRNGSIETYDGEPGWTATAARGISSNGHVAGCTWLRSPH